jgi:hypothetical protein
MRKLIATTMAVSRRRHAGDVPLRSFLQDEPSEKEVERRAKLAREAG